MTMLATGPLPTLTSHQTLILCTQVATLLAVAVVLGRLAVRAGIPALAGELIAGVLIGPSLLGHVSPALSGSLFQNDAAQLHMLDAVGQVGVLLLVGITGLHLDLGLVRRRSGVVARIAGGAVLVPFALGAGAAMLIPARLAGPHAHRVAFAMFLATALGVSALPVIAKTLFDMNLMHRNVGQLILASGSVDDIVGWILLAMTVAVAGSGATLGGLGRTVAYLIGFLGVAAFLARPLLRALFRRIDRGSDAGVPIAVTVVVIFIGAAITQGLGLEALFGAFIAGIVLGAAAPGLNARLAPLRTVVMAVLAPIFFATAGLRIDLSALIDPATVLAGVALFAIAVIAKFGGVALGTIRSGMSRWEVLALGAGLNARGVVEVVIAMIGLRTGILTPAMFTVIVLIAIGTSIMAPPILRFAMGRLDSTEEESMRRETMFALAGNGRAGDETSIAADETSLAADGR